MKKILVVGSKGFIGSHAYQYFSTQPSILCWACDVVVDYTDSKYFVIDSSNSDFNEVFEAEKFDYCLNCSGAASVPDSLKHPLRDFSLNTYNVIKMLEAIRRHAPKCKFINLSSAAVYGNPKHLPISEVDNCNPVSPYGQHKLFSESICKEYFEYFDISTCSLRIFSAYGPGLRKQLFWDVYQKSLKSNCIELFGTGKESRDFIYIEDILLAIKSVINGSDFTANIYNLASGVEVSIAEAAKALLSQLNYKGELVFSGSERIGDPINWIADISELNKLGYSPMFPIEVGVKKIVQWLKEEK